MTHSIAYLPQRGLPGIQPLDEALESAPLPLIVERRARSDRRGQREMREEWLPFTVEVVRDVESLQAAVRVRQQAYSRHLPTFSATLAAPEAADLEPGVALLLAPSKLDGTPLGSMRIQTNLLRPLPVEASVELPSALRDANLAEATRLGLAVGDAGSLVKSALFKAFYLYCQQHEIDLMVVAGRPPIDRQYLRLLFREVFPERGLIPLRHAANIAHRVMSLDLLQADRIWHEAQHPLCGFICHTAHPDIQVGVHAPRVRAMAAHLRQWA